METTIQSISTVDSVTLEWDSAYHNVMQCADAQSMANCDCSTDLTGTSNSGSYTFSSSTEGTFYFISSVSTDCEDGQYMMISVDSYGSCEDSKGAEKCSKWMAKGKCAKYVSKKCESTCGGCGAYESCDEDADSEKKCAKVVSKGKCSKKKKQKKCMTSCFAEVGC
jgi:hypothetical protein